MVFALAGALFAASPGRALEAGVQHLLSGATEFRSGRFERALVEFRVAEQLGAGQEAAWYVAATLAQLGRVDEAIEKFDAAERAGKDGGDVVLDFYRASACYEARLYLTADRLLQGLGERAGPRIGEEARKLRERIAALFTGEPAEAVIDWYHAQARAEVKAGRLALARAYWSEAIALSSKRAAPYKLDEAQRGLQEAAPAAGGGSP